MMNVRIMLYIIVSTPLHSMAFHICNIDRESFSEPYN
jgi:hypothetical protein